MLMLTDCVDTKFYGRLKQQRVTGLHLHAIQLRYDRYTARLGETTRYYRVPMPM